MRRLVAVLTVLVALAVPAAAAASVDFSHVDFHNTSGCTWSCTALFGNTGFQNLGCGQQVNIGPWQTNYVWNAHDNNSSTDMHVGVGEFINWNIYPADSDFTTGTETREFHWVGGGFLDTRRIKQQVDGLGNNFFYTVKMVNRGSQIIVLHSGGC